MFVLFRRCFKTVMLNKFLKLTIANSNVVSKDYNRRYGLELSISMLKEINPRVQGYVSETRR